MTPPTLRISHCQSSESSHETAQAESRCPKAGGNLRRFVKRGSDNDSDEYFKLESHESEVPGDQRCGPCGPCGPCIEPSTVPIVSCGVAIGRMLADRKLAWFTRCPEPRRIRALSLDWAPNRAQCSLPTDIPKSGAANAASTECRRRKRRPRIPGRPVLLKQKTLLPQLGSMCSGGLSCLSAFGSDLLLLPQLGSMCSGGLSCLSAFGSDLLDLLEAPACTSRGRAALRDVATFCQTEQKALGCQIVRGHQASLAERQGMSISPRSFQRMSEVHGSQVLCRRRGLFSPAREHCCQHRACKLPIRDLVAEAHIRRTGLSV